MNNGGDIPVSFFTCDVAPQRLFAHLSADAARDYLAIQSVQEVPKGTLLFSEGQLPNAVVMLHSGGARLSVCSSRGEKLTLRMAKMGEVLGLSANVSGKPHEVTAETTVPSQIIFIKRKDFLRFLKEHSDACMQVVQMLSNDVHAAYDRVRAIGMARARHVRN
jgi:CRP/FNR family transcriptional regulator